MQNLCQSTESNIDRGLLCQSVILKELKQTEDHQTMGHAERFNQGRIGIVRAVALCPLAFAE